MANFTCDGPDDDQAIFLVQNILEAEVMTFCLACTLDFAQALLQEFAPDRLAPPPPRRGRKPKGAAAAAAADRAEGGEQDGTAEGKNGGTAARVG